MGNVFTTSCYIVSTINGLLPPVSNSVCLPLYALGGTSVFKTVVDALITYRIYDKCMSDSSCAALAFGATGLYLTAIHFAGYYTGRAFRDVVHIINEKDRNDPYSLL
jgi:hypothetical protein